LTMALLWFYLLFYGVLVLGLLLRKWQSLAPTIMRYTILLVDAPLFMYSFWILDLAKLRHYAPVPVIATLLVVLPLWLTPFWARRLLSKKTAQGSFILSAAFSNVGTTGGAFICYLLFGLPGLSLAYLFLLPYPILIFTLGFSTAKHHACDCQLKLKDYFLNLTTNLISIIPLAAIALGVLLNASALQPPAVSASWADIWIKLGLGMMCLAIGMTLRLQHIFSRWKLITALGLIKFLGIPTLALLLVSLTYGSWTLFPAKVILIQSAMPPAIYAVITANLFGLDRDLVNALWFSTTLLLIPIAGILFLFIG